MWWAHAGTSPFGVVDAEARRDTRATQGTRRRARRNDGDEDGSLTTDGDNARQAGELPRIDECTRGHACDEATCITRDVLMDPDVERVRGEATPRNLVVRPYAQRVAELVPLVDAHLYNVIEVAHS